MQKQFKLTFVALALLVLMTGVAGAAPAYQDGGQEYVVQADDWLSKLADKHYGDILAWPVIWEATNAKAAEDDSFAAIEDPNLIEVGQKLWIPDAEAAGAAMAEDAGAGEAMANTGDDFQCPAGPFDPPTLSEPELVWEETEVFTQLEGIVWVADQQAVYFSHRTFGEEEPFTIRRLAFGASEPEIFAEENASNGLALTADSKLAAAVEQVEPGLFLYNFDTKERTPIVTEFEGAPFNRPNDIAISADGSIYFTDPNFGDITNQPLEGVYRLPAGADASEIELLDGTIFHPNGINFSPSQEYLYVAHFTGVNKYPVEADGTLGEGETIIDDLNIVDGMAVDCAGNLYITENRAGMLHVLDPDGALLQSVEIAPQVTNVAFGGPDRKTIYITNTATRDEDGNRITNGGVRTITGSIPGFPY